jgi:hypothetical protein
MNSLLQQVQQLGEALAAHLPDYDLRPIFRNMTLGTAKKGHLLDLTRSGQVVLNTAHPLAAKLTDGKPGRAEVLVTAIISLINRADKELTDHHQRELHQVLLQQMVSEPAQSAAG